MDPSSFPVSTILIIAGLLFMFIAVVEITGIYNFHVINRYFAFCIGVILLLGGVFLTEEYGTIGINVKNPEITFNYTFNKAHIEENMNGTAKNIPEGDEIWIFVHPDGLNKYYPQRSSAVIQSGKWSLSVVIGSENDDDKKFDIIAVLADTKAQEEINSYFAECEKTGVWPGMDKIPDSAKEYNRITVTRLPIPPEINITYPLNASKVKIRENIQGTARNIPEGQTAWLIIYPHTAYKYYPQNKLDIRDEKWSYPAQFGGEEHVGDKFDIIVLLADQKAHAELANYLETCIKTNTWPGTMTLPVGVKEYARVTVTRE
ncbi:MAG: hypothetical protein Q8903_13980 [Bacteroidota bacterium]|nr:hypothetical protein [Bacteroidota bacterium]